MKDTIYREDAIRAVCKGCREEFKECAHHWSCPKLNELAAVPSADRPQGEWIDDGFAHRCSICGKQGVGIEYYNYCPNCGARMKGVDDE